ncbi:centrosome-associated protein ALMS1 isoform X2 [Talpa occidentalis]|uniref:centrosome-associated protein ALMS1 isoform X2 n=1 Tax=Talpa occidentalis TaxID=50954 RepID=UPI0023F98AA2|nr:centrosome-associated protein ALMS1 isoform X2 [Talpa occidentalis]
MEPEDLPWPSELEEEEVEVEEVEEAEEEPEAGSLGEDEVVTVEDVEEQGLELGADCGCEAPPRECTDDEDDEEAKAWLEAQPSGTLTAPTLPRHRYLAGERPGPERRTESWDCLPQEMDSSQTLTTPKTRFNVREEETKVTDFPSLEEGVLTQSENHVKESNRDLLCSPLLVIQDNFASPDLPLLTCVTRDLEFGPDSLFQQSEVDFAPLRRIPGKSEDTEWFSRPSEVSEALFQAASKVASDLVNNCFSVSQHPHTGSTTVGSQYSFLPPEQGSKEETISSETVDELKTPKDSDSYDALCSYMSWKTQEVIQEPETNLGDKDQVSISTSTDVSDEYIIPKGSEHFGASCSYVQYWNRKTLQQSEKYLTRKDHDSFSDSSDTIDKNKIPKGNDSFSAPFSYMPCSKQGASHYPKICPISMDYVSFPHEVAPHFKNEISCSFLHCLLGRRGKEFPLMSGSHCFESVYLGASAENKVKQKMDSLEGYERNEEGLGKELPQYFDLKEDRNTLEFSEVHPRSSKIQYIENIVPDNSVKVSKVRDTFNIETSGGPLQTVKSNLDETSEQLYFQEERNQKATFAFGGGNVDASENIAFEAVIASIEPSKKERVRNEIQTDITKSLTNDSQESEPEISDLSLLSYDENFFFDSHPCYQSTPGVFEQAASRPLLHKKDGDDSSLYWHPNLKSPPINSQEIFINPFSVTPELKSSLSEKALGLGKMQSPLFQCDTNNEPFLPIGKIKSVSALDLAVKVGSSNIFFPVKVSTSDSLVSQDFKELTDFSNCTLGKNVNSNNITEGPPSAIGSSFSANLVSCDVESQGALPLTSDASLIAVGQEILLKADIGQGEIPQPMGAKCSFTIHTIMQNDSYFIEGLQGKAESDICTLDDDIESCSLDENAVVCSERVAELQREICDQGDLTSECIELAGLENVLDQDIGRSSLHWKSPLKLPSKEEGSFEEPVDHSNVDIKQPFPSILPSFVPHESVRELNYHPADLRMLRVSPDTVPKTPKHLTGVTSKGGITDITHSNLRPDITTTPGVSDIESHLSLSPDEFSHLAVRSPQDNIIDQHTDSINQQALADSHLTEETLKVSAVRELADQKTGISTVPTSSYSQRGKPHIFYPQAVSGSHLTEQAQNISAAPGFSEQKTGIPAVTSTTYSHREQPNIFYRQELPVSHLPEETLKVSAASGPAAQKAGIPEVPPTSYSVGEKHNIFYQQTLPGSHPTEETLKVLAVSGPGDQKSGKTTVTFSLDPYREKHIIFSQQQLPVSHLPEEGLKVSASFGSADQKTGIPTGPSTSHSHGEKTHIFYPQALPESHLSEQAQKVSAVPGFTDQRTGISAITSPSYSHREKSNFFHQQELPESQLIKEAHTIPGTAHQKSEIPLASPTSYSNRGVHGNFYQHELPNSHLTEEALKVSAAPGSIDQKTGLPSEPFTSYSHRDKPVVFYQQEFLDSSLTEQAQRVSAAPGSAGQRTGVSAVTSAPYSHRDQPFIFYQQKLTDNNLTEEALRGSAVPGPVDHRAEIQTGSARSYLFEEKPNISYQQTLPGSHLPEEAQKISVALGSAEKKTGLLSEPFTSHSYRDKPGTFYQQEFPDSPPTEQAQKVSAVPGLADQRTGISKLTSSPYAHKEQPFIFYQQKLPEDHLTEEAQKVSAVLGTADQKTGLPSEPYASFSHTAKPVTFYQQEFPETSLTEQAQKVSAVPGPTDQKTGLPSEAFTFYSHTDKPVIFYQQALPDNLLTEQAQKVSAASGSADQRTGLLTVTSIPYARRDQPSLFYHQELQESPLTEQAQKVSAAPGSAGQRTGISTVTSSPYAHEEQPFIFYQQKLPESHLTEEAQNTSAVPGPTDQKTGLPSEAFTFYSHRDKPIVFYQQELPDNLLPEQAQKVLAASGSADQRTGISTVSSSSTSLEGKPIIFYPQALPNRHLTEEAPRVSAASGSADQRNGKSTVTSIPYAHREQPFIFYQKELQESPLPEQVQKVSAAPGSADQRTGISTVTSIPYVHREQPFIFYQQELQESPLPEEGQKVSTAPGSAGQRTGIATVTSIPYAHKEQPFIFYQQKLPESHLTEEAQNTSVVPGPTDQKTGLPSEPLTSYSHRDKPVVFYKQFPDSPLTEQAQKVSVAPGSAGQRTGLSTVTPIPYAHREQPFIFYQQELQESLLTEQAQKVSAAPGSAEQRTGISTVTSSPYIHKEQPFNFHQQKLPESHLTEEAQNTSVVPGPTDQKTGLPSEPFTSYSHRDKPIVFYEQEFPDSSLTEQAQKVLAAPGSAGQRTGISPVSSSSSSLEGKHIIFYPQALTDRHLTEEAPEVSAAPGSADQRTGISTATSIPYAHKEQPFIFYQQKLPESHLTEEAENTSAVSGPTDQKTGLPSEPLASYSQRDKPVVFYEQEFPDNSLIEQAQKVLAAPRSASQGTGISTVSSSSSLEGKPIIFYPQALPNRHLTEEAPIASAAPESASQRTGISTVSSSSSLEGKPIIFYPQALPNRHLTEEAPKVSAASDSADQRSGESAATSIPYSHREKSIIFYQQALPDSPLTEEAQKVSPVPGTGDQRTRIPVETSVSYSHREKPIISYQQELSDSHLTEEALKISSVSESTDQKTVIPTALSSSYSYEEEPAIFYQQELPDITEEALKIIGGPGAVDQKTGISAVTSSYSHREKPIVSYQQELIDTNDDVFRLLGLPVSVDQKTGVQIVPTTFLRELPVFSYQKDLPDVTEETLKVSAVPGPAEQKTGKRIVSSASLREGPIFSYQKDLPGISEETLKFAVVPEPADQKTGIQVIPSSSSSYRGKAGVSFPQEVPNLTKETLKVFALPGSAEQKTESSTISPSPYLQREKPKDSPVIGPEDQKTPSLAVVHDSYSQRVKPSIFFQQQLTDKHESKAILKISTVPEPTEVDSGIPLPLPSSFSHREKSNIFYSQELPDNHLTENALKVSVIPGQANQKTLLPTTLPSSFSPREKPDISYRKDLPNRHLVEGALMLSSGLGQDEKITRFSTVSPDTYSRSEKHKLVSDHVQRLIDNLDSSNSSLTSNSMPLNSQADSRIVINKPESSGFEDVGSKDIRDTGSGSKTLKEIRTLLMEAENIALKRCNFSSPLVPFRDVNDISYIQSKKVVCFKEPPTTDNSHGDLPHKQSFTEENPANQYIQKDISTQTNMKCQRGIENWEFISSTTVRSPLEEAESKARVTLDETLRQYKAARSVMRSEPEGYSRTIGNKIVIPMMTIIKSDSSSDASSCSWDSNSLESVSDVLLNFFPYASPKTSMTDSREEEGVSESDDAASSVDSLAAHVKNLLKCESSLNHAKQILKNAEEEECRVRARAWNLKFNLAREYECGYSISELNEDDRRKVEEIKAKLFAHERTTALSKGLRSPQGIGCKPGAVCSHIIIESHEKGCFRTLTAEQPQLDTHPCVFRSAEPSEMIRGQRSPSSWRSRHINLCKSLDQNNPHFKVWNSLQFQSHSPFENFTADDFNISKGLQMPFHEKMDPWLSELVDPACVLPSEEMECHFPSRSSSQMPPPESMKKFTTSITFSSHRHSKCISDSSVFKVGVTEGSQCTGASMGVFNSHFTEEQNIPRDLKQRTCSPSSFKTLGHSPDKTVTILAESSRQNQKLPVELSHQEEKLLERSHFKGSHFEPSTHADSHNFKEVHFSDNNTPINLDRPSSTPSIKEKNITITPDLPSHIFLEQRELFEQCKFPPTDHHVGKHSPPPQHQDYLAPNLPCHIFLEKRDFFEQAPHVEHQMKENESPIPQGQDSIASGTPCSIFLEQRKLFEQSKAPNKDYHIRKHPSSLPQDEDCVVEKKNQHKHKSHISNMINVEPSSNNVVSQPTSNQYTVVTSTSTPPSNRKAISCVRITLGPKTPSKLDSGTLDKTFQSLDPASKTRMNSEFNSDLQTISSRSLEPTSKLLTSKTIAQDQEFLGPKSSPDLEVVQSPLPDNYIQDLKIIPSENSQLVTSRQTQVNNSDLERYSNPEGTPVSADRPSEEIKTPFSTFSGKLLSDAVTQITTESPDKTLLSSEIFINDTDLAHAIPEPKTQKMLSKVPIKLASSSSIQQISVSRGPDAQPSLLPYKPSGDTKMYYVPQLSQIPPSLDSKSDTTIESSHSGSNDAVAPDFPAQVLGTRDDDLAVTVNIKHKEGIYSKRAVSKAALSVRKNPFQKDNTDAEVQVIFTKDERLLDKNGEEEIHSNWAVTVGARSEEKESLQKDTAGSSDAAATGSSAQLPDTKIENLPDTEEIKQIEEVQSKRPVTKEAWSENKESLQIDIAGSGFENTTHSVFRSAKFYFHHPVHLSNDQDFFHESLGRSVFMKHSWKDFFQHHPDKYREHTYPPPPFQNAEKSKADYPKIESLSINVNLENKEAVNDQTREYPKVDQKINDPKRYHKVTPEQTTQHTASLNELWNKYQERQSQQKPSEFTDKKELSLVERLDRLAKLLQNPITHSLQAVESTQDDSKGEQDVKEWSGKQQQQKNKLQKKKRYKSIEKCHKNTGDLKKNKVFPAHQMGRSNQIKIEQIKFDKYILRKQPGCHYINNTSSDSRPSEESDLLTDTPTNILSPTTSVDSDILTQTDKEVTYERSSSISTIDTARLIQAFGHERVCLSPRQIKLYSSITDHQRRYLEKRSRNKRALNIGHPQMTSEHTRRKHIQVSNHVISSDSISSPTSSFWSLSSTFCNKKNVQMLNKGVQAGNLEIVNGVKKHTRDVGMTFPTPGSREARVEEDSDVTSWLEDKIEEKMFLTNYLGDRKSRKNKQRCCEGVSWFVPVENVKSGSKKENLPKFYGPGISWFAPITSTKPWREPLREQNWQEQCMDSHRPLAGPGRDPPMPFVRATLQESLWLHRPDFISRSGERIKRLKLIVQERKLQNMLQSEREALFNTVREWQGYRDPMNPLSKRGFLAAQKNRPVGKKEMIQRSKRIYEQLPEVQKKREEEKRRSEYKSYRLRAQLYKKKVTNQLLGRKVPWD